MVVMTSNDSLNQPIPEWLHSVQHECPFAQCVVCNGSLGGDAEYTIMKSFQRGECVFEMAVCSTCNDERGKRWSSKSRKAAEDFQFRSADHLLHEEGEACDYCGKPVSRVAGVAVYARCEGDQYWMANHMCYPCEDELHELLSPETREEHDRFISTYAPGPPSLEQPMPRESPAQHGPARIDADRATRTSAFGPLGTRAEVRSRSHL